MRPLSSAMIIGLFATLLQWLIFTLDSSLTSHIVILAVTVVVICLSQLGVKGVVILLFSAYKRFRVMWLGLFGLTLETEAEQLVVSGKSWDEFCDTLKAAGAVLVMNGVPRDPRNQAEGYRYLSRLVRAGLENFVENCDPSTPKLTCIVDGTRSAPIKLGSDNPDNFYPSAPLLNEYDYVLEGERGTAHSFSIATQAGSYGQPGGLRTLAIIDLVALAGVGRFKVLVSREYDDGGGGVIQKDGIKYDFHLPLSATEPRGQLVVRQTFLHREREVPANLCLRRISRDGDASTSAPPPPPLTCQQLCEGLHSTSLLVSGASMMFARWSIMFEKHVNALPLFDPARSTAVGGDPNIAYFHSAWKLEPDEALMITVNSLPKCQYWNFQVNNFWLESLDYAHHPIHVNNGTALLSRNGSSVRIVLADLARRTPKTETPKEDLQINWLGTTGLLQGTMSFRYAHPEGWPEVVPREPEVKVVKVHEI